VCAITESYRYPTLGECGLPLVTFDETSRVWANSHTGLGECCWVTLQSQPVVAITEVLINDVALDASAYRLSGNRLGRIGACWTPTGVCDPDALVVTYRWGVPIDGTSAEALAMGELAQEVLNFLTDNECRLPWLAGASSRTGTSVTMMDPADLDKINRIGLPLCDHLIGSLNPYGRHARSRVVSPDTALRTGAWSA
jgi:hypothetical protein